uniref:Elongation of very long chain fatty acids protein n=1 Tax=Rhabditophanes sp. KR3021 TaxID=114890 RepID=A0AC35U5Q2_9BILA
MAQYDYERTYSLGNDSFVMPFEKNFDTRRSTTWMQENWYHSFTWSIGYVAAIYVGQKIMRNRASFKLDTPLLLWNLGLAIFSICGVLRMTPEMYWSIFDNSMTYSICSASFSMGVTGFWTEMFAMSKVAEFGDTAFIVLRKRPLIFLHWYHHITVLAYTWHAYKDHTASGRWFIWMNYMVHAVMYSYYALRAAKIRVPKFAAMITTILQILQMVGGVSIGIAVYRIKSSGGQCQQTWENLFFSFGIYFSYFLLFCQFFYKAYLSNNNKYDKKVVGDKKKSDEIKSFVPKVMADINSNDETIEPLQSASQPSKQRRQWHCENEYIKQIVEDALTQYSPDVDLIQQYVTSEMEAYLLESQTQWIMTAIKIERSVSFIDDNAEKSQWFCSMYDQETSIRVNVIRIYNANEFSRSRRLSVLKHSL